MSWSDSRYPHDLGFRAWVVSVFLLLLPTAVLGALACRVETVTLATGAGVQLLFALVFFRAHPVWRPPVSASLGVLYLVALGWAWVPTRGSDDWAAHAAQGILLLGAVGLVALHDLTRTGAEPLRRASKWARRISARRRWPAELVDCRILPEANALRAAIWQEAAPALALLSDPRAQVQVAALGALEYRPYWRPGEAELVLKVARGSPEPVVRASAAYALAGVRNPELIDALGGFLRDSSPMVRNAACEALLWEGDSRWPAAREAVREALADPNLADDGPLFVGATRLPVVAVADLTAWAGEHPPLSGRAVHTLIEQYHRALLDADRPELASELAFQMLAPETPPGLRIELAGLLRDHHMLGPDLLDLLSNPDQPAPMRLFAAEVMLRNNPDDPDGVDVLRGLARQPNRELAVQIGGILQNVLGLDLGLPDDGQLPAPNSKPAADVARRVQMWANGVNPQELTPAAGSQTGLVGAARGPVPGLQATNINLPPPGDRPSNGSSAVF